MRTVLRTMWWRLLVQVCIARMSTAIEEQHWLEHLDRVYDN